MDPLESDKIEIPWYMKTKHEYAHDWFLMSSPFPLVILVVAYLVFILKLGPALMEKLAPFTLKKPLLIYNTFQVFFSTYQFIIGIGFISTYGLFGADKCWFNDSLAAEKTIMEGIHLYFVAKVTELVDTVFFVLRKKKNQISFLHWYHHCLMMLSTYIALKYTPSYSVVFLGTINSFVHIVMYSYYWLSAFPRLEKYLWWKKYLTSFQLIQFVLIIIHLLVFSYISKCPTPYFLLFNILLNALFLLYLFSAFYVKSYVNKRAYNNNSLCKEKNENSFVNSINYGVTRRYGIS